MVQSKTKTFDVKRPPTSGLFAYGETGHFTDLLAWQTAYSTGIGFTQFPKRLGQFVDSVHRFRLTKIGPIYVSLEKNRFIGGIHVNKK